MRAHSRQLCSRYDAIYVRVGPETHSTFGSKYQSIFQISSARITLSQWATSSEGLMAVSDQRALRCEEERPIRLIVVKISTGSSTPISTPFASDPSTSGQIQKPSEVLRIVQCPQIARPL